MERELETKIQTPSLTGNTIISQVSKNNYSIDAYEENLRLPHE